MGKRHFTPAEIKRQMVNIAREKRQCTKTPWTASMIMIVRTMLKFAKWDTLDILTVINRINSYDCKLDSGEITMDQLGERWSEVFGEPLEIGQYSEADIKAPKGTYEFRMLQLQIEPQNIINNYSSSYFMAWIAALRDMKKGKKFCQDCWEWLCTECLMAYKEDFPGNKVRLTDIWNKEILEAGIELEYPNDKSMMLGGKNET